MHLLLTVFEPFGQDLKQFFRYKTYPVKHSLQFVKQGTQTFLGSFKGIIYYIIVKDFYEPVDVTPEDHWLEKAIKKYIPYSDSDDELFT